MGMLLTTRPIRCHDGKSIIPGTTSGMVLKQRNLFSITLLLLISYFRQRCWLLFVSKKLVGDEIKWVMSCDV